MSLNKLPSSPCSVLDVGEQCVSAITSDLPQRKLYAELEGDEHRRDGTTSSYLVYLCKNKQWEEAKERAMSNPIEALPPSTLRNRDISIGSTKLPPIKKQRSFIHIESSNTNVDVETFYEQQLYHRENSFESLSSNCDTALAIACRNCGSFTQSVGQNQTAQQKVPVGVAGQSRNVAFQFVTLDVIKAIHDACPDQIHMVQSGRGTPLHEAINANAPLSILKFLIEKSSVLHVERFSEHSAQLGVESVSSPSAIPICSIHSHHDSTLSTPCVKWTSQTYTKARKRAFDEANVSDVEEDDYPRQHLAVLNQDDNGMTPLDLLLMMVLLGKPKHYVDALVHLVTVCPETLSHRSGRNPLLRFLGLALPDQDTARDKRILKITKLFVSVRPQLTHIPSIYTGFTPLHLALLYHGHSKELVGALLEAAPIPRKCVQTKSAKGELPLHTAVRAGVPTDTLKLVILASATANVVQTADVHGMTPIHLAWVRRVHPEFGVRDRRLHGTEPIFGRLLDEAVGDAIKKINNYSKQNGRDARMETVSCVFGSFWERSELLLKAAYHGTVSDLPKDNKWRLVHAAVAVRAPRAILNVALSIDPEQVRERDEDGRFPLHVAAGSPNHPWWWTPEDPPKKKGCTGDESGHQNERSSIEILLDLYPEAAGLVDKQMQLPLHTAIESEKECGRDAWGSGVNKIAKAFPEALERRDPKFHLYPFMQAAIGECASTATIYNLLRDAPSLVACGIPSASLHDWASLR